MVTFKLVEETKTELTLLAEDDRERDIPAEEINELINAINQMEKETGGTAFVEHVTEPVHSTFYGDHAVSEIIKFLNKGEIPKEGSQMWY